MDEIYGIDRTVPFWYGSGSEARDSGSGYEISKVEDGKVTFLADAEGIAQANMFLRTTVEDSAEDRRV